MALDAIIHRTQPSWWQRLQEAPYQTLAKMLYARRQHIITEQLLREAASVVTVVCVSDTHNHQPILPPGDVLIHAGDMTQSGTAQELQSQLDWLHAQPHPHKVVIAGNHDIVLDGEKSAEFGFSPSDRKSLRWGSVTYLEHSSAILRLANGRRLHVFGHPSTRKQGNWAFQFDRGTDVFTDRIDDDVDILVTHSAPRFHLDVAGWGDEFLLRELWRVRPSLHVFGHLHEGYGRDILIYDHFEYLYEQICAGYAGLLALLHMAWLLLCGRATDSRNLRKRTNLINASAVGGVVDQNHRELQTARL